MSTLPAERRQELDRVQFGALAVGVVALVICTVGAFFDPKQFFRAYLTAYLFWLGLPLGCMSILMIYHLTGGAWGFLVRRTLEAGTRTLPLMALLFIPVAVGVKQLYVWTDLDKMTSPAMRQKVHYYLNEPFFYARAAAYFILWNALAYVLNYLSRKQDESGDKQLLTWLERVAGPGLVVYGVTITFASIDWVMSLQPAFRSTIFGPIFAAGEILSAHAFVVIVLAWLITQPPLSSVYSKEAFIDLGSLLFTFLVVWSYVLFFQFMLIWIANLRYDIIWLLPRSRDGWQWVAWALFVFGFAVPFLLLLMRGIKRDPRSLAQVAWLLLFMQLVFMYFQVMPFFPGTHIGQHWMDFLTPFGVGGLWLALFCWQLKRAPVLPRHDVNAPEASHLRHLDEEQRAREEAIHHG